MSKVYFVGGAYMGCWQVRCLLPMIHNGWLGNYKGLKKELKPASQVKEEMVRSDIVVFHRADTNWHHRIGMLLRQMGKKIVFDNDDTMNLDISDPFYELDEKGFKQNKKKLNNVINNFVLNADLVTCSTEFLAEEYRKINPNVAVLPNYIDPNDFDMPLRNESEKVRIGIVGSTAYHGDFYRIKDILCKLDADPKIQLVLMGLMKTDPNNPKIAEVHKKELAFWESLKNLEWTHWVPMTEYYSTLNELRLDVMLIPRRESYFNKAKSNLKFLEASMLEIPVIASSFKNAPYEEITSGKNGGILIKDDKDWLEAINSLVNDKEKRRTMGKEAYDYVLKNFNINNHYQAWPETYNKLIK